MAKKFTWKIWLLPNLMTKDVQNDSVADVSTAGNTKHNEDIAKAIKEEGSDLQLETIVDVLNRGDRWRRRYLLEGSSVQDGNIRLAPRVKGNWEGADPLFDPKEHKLTVDAIPTAELRKAIEEEVGIELLGKKTDGGAIIGLVTDITTGKTDGTITQGGNIIITGEKIKIAPIDAYRTMGVFYIAADGTVWQDYSPLVLNDPKRIITRVPNLPEATFRLEIRTQYSHGATLLKAPRTIIYELPLNVVVSP
ncbi:MAG: DUF4469 domain-containing protein [Prevotellaceae bacterium]|jgi:hypothetical protein|nr:DUF4469 domain-containing protein [Prevotellaceae bacterium]